MKLQAQAKDTHSQLIASMKEHLVGNVNAPKKRNYFGVPGGCNLSSFVNYVSGLYLMFCWSITCLCYGLLTLIFVYMLFYMECGRHV